jgi:hypothetical protein
MLLEETDLAVDLDPNIGDHRARQAAGDDRHRALHRFLRADEVRRPPPFDGETLDERRVHVGADAEGEDARAAAEARGGIGDRVRVPLAHRRGAVGEEEDHRKPLGVAVEAQRLLERAGDVRRPFGAQVVDVPARRVQVRAGGGDEGVAEGAHVGGEVDEPEAVARA